MVIVEEEDMKIEGVEEITGECQKPWHRSHSDCRRKAMLKIPASGTIFRKHNEKKEKTQISNFQENIEEEKHLFPLLNICAGITPPC